MDRLTWVESNFDVRGPHDLQSRGVNVYFPPNIPYGVKTVNLVDGSIKLFQDGEDRSQKGAYADFDSLARFCLEMGRPLVETNGVVSTEPVETGDAGDPLLRGRR